MSRQLCTWSEIDHSLSVLFSDLSAESLSSLVPRFFKVNLVRATPLFILHFLTHLDSHPENASVLASLLATLNCRLPDLGLKTVRCLVASMKRLAQGEETQRYLGRVAVIGYLVRNRTVAELVGLQIFANLLTAAELTAATLERVCTFVEASGFINRHIRDTLRKILISQRMSPALTQRFRSLLSNTQSSSREDEDTVTHEVDFDEVAEEEAALDGACEVIEEEVFEENERKWKEIVEAILPGEESTSEATEEDAVTAEEQVQLRKRVYLTLMSSVNADEAAHKILRQAGTAAEVAKTILEACAIEKVYKNFQASVSERLMRVNRQYQAVYGEIFANLYDEAFKVETDKLRNMAKFFGYLLAAEVLDWRVLKVCRLTEEDTTAGGRVLLKFLFQEIAELIGNKKMTQKLEDDQFLEAIDHAIFPMDSADNLRFAINFFTAIGLGTVTQAARRRLAAVVAAERIADDPPSKQRKQ